MVAFGRALPAPPGERVWPGGHPFGGYGPAYVVLEGESGHFHLLAHLAWPLPEVVTLGAALEEGAELGQVSHLAHAHWEVRTRLTPPGHARAWTIALDPAAWLRGEDVPAGSRAAPPDPEEDPTGEDVLTPGPEEAPPEVRPYPTGNVEAAELGPIDAPRPRTAPPPRARRRRNGWGLVVVIVALAFAFGGKS